MTCLKFKSAENSTLYKGLINKFGDNGKAIFQALQVESHEGLSFIKWFDLEGDLLTEDGEPLLEDVERWIDYINNHNRIHKTFATPTLYATTEEFHELSEGFTFYLMDTLYRKGFTPNDLFNSQLGTELNEKKIFNSSLSELTDVLSQSSDDRVIELRDAIVDNKYFFYKAYNNYTKITLKFDVDVENILSEEIEFNDNKETKDTAFNKSAFEFDTKDSAPPAIKLLISSIPEVENNRLVKADITGLPKLVDYNKVFNTLQQKLVNIPPDILLFTEEIEKLYDNIPGLKLLNNRLQFGSTYVPSSNSNVYARQQLLRTQFVNQFDKTQNQFSLHLKEEGGNIRIIDQNLDKIENKLFREWQNNFEMKKTLVPDMYSKISEYAEDKENLLLSLGITADPINVDDTILNDIISIGFDNEDTFTNLYTPQKGEGVKSKILAIARKEAETSDDTIDFQHFNAENKLVYGITLNTYLSTIAKDLSYYAGNEAKLIELYPEIFNNPYSQSSEWLEMIKNGDEIAIGIFDGFKNEDKASAARSSKNLKEKDIIIQRVIGVLKEGKYPFLRSADRGIENYFYFKNIKPAQTNLLVTDKESFKRYLMRHLQDEIAAKYAGKLNIAFYDINNENSRVFYIENSKGEKESIFDLDVDFLKENYTQNQQVINFINTLTDQIISKEQELFENNKVFPHLEQIEKEFNGRQNVIDLFAINSFAANIEQTKLFTGDLAFYKDASEIFKRMSMLNSTKENLRTDEEIGQYLDSIEHVFEKSLGYIGNYNTNKIKTITINDIKTNINKDFDKETKNTLEKAFGKDYDKYTKGTYDNMNEADGFAYITYDEYRRLGIRSSEWNVIDEELYQSIASGNYSYAGKVIRRVTMKKYQYTGKLFNYSNVNIPAGRKFAFLPLVPGTFKENSNLAKLNKTMLENGVGMAFMTSAAKFGYTSPDGVNAYHNFYDKDGNFNIDASENQDILDYKYLGNQLKIHNKPKDRNTASTQKRKIIKSNIYENGELKNSELKPLIERYDNLQSQIVKNALNDLFTRYKVNIDTKLLETDKLESFVNELIEQGIKRGFNTNDLKALQYLNEIPLIDLLPNKPALENLINANLKNNVISNKRKGDGLTQASDVGFELDVEGSNRNNLKFYRYNKIGKLLPMQIMVALPEDLIDYVSVRYNDGKGLTEEALYKFNQQLARDIEKYEDGEDMTSLLKISTYVGFRIPNQAVNSSDVGQVKEYLMPHFGGTIIVPKPIVAKTGSDYDADKLNVYKPHYNVIKKGKMIKFEYINPKANILTMTNNEIENSLLQTEIDITLHPYNHKQLLAPLTEITIKEIVNDIRSIRGESGKRDHISDVFTNKMNIEKFISFLSGKGGVGQVAVHITNHVLAQQAGLRMKAIHDYFNISDPTENFIELGLIENNNGDIISEILSELLTSYVDIAKDPYILDINAIQSTANTILMMLRWGISPKTVFYFMNQPIIKTYLKEQQLNEAVVIDKKSGKVTKDVLRNRVLLKYDIKVNENKLISYVEEQIDKGNNKYKRLDKIYNDFTDSELKTAIKVDNEGKKPDKDVQLKSLDVFLELQRQSKLFQKMIRSTSPDTQPFKNLSTLESQILLRNEVANTDMFINYNKMFDNFIGEYYNAKVKYFDAIKSIFINQHSEYKQHLDNLKNITTSKIYGQNEKERVINKIENDFISFILADHGTINFEKGFNNLFKGKNSIPKIIKYLQKRYDNKFLEEILPIIDNKSYDNMKFTSKTLTNIQSELITTDFSFLQEADSEVFQKFNIPNFYKALIAYSIIQSGINNSPYSFHKVIPSKDYFNFIKDAMIHAMNGQTDVRKFSEIQDFAGEFILNNPGLYFNKYDIPFKVSYDKSISKYHITKYIQGLPYRIEQLGDGIGYSIYGTFNESKSTDSEEGDIESKSPTDKFQLSGNEIQDIDPKFEGKINKFLKSIGVSVEIVDKILDNRGKYINAYGKANLINDVIQITGKRRVDTLPEEAAHMITAMMGKRNPLMKTMIDDIDQYPEYQEVLDEYKNIYNNDEDFKFEAVGKVIAKNLIEKNKLPKNLFDNLNNWFKKVIRSLRRVLFGKNLNFIKDQINAFDLVADAILKNNVDSLGELTGGYTGEFLQKKTQNEIVQDFLRDFNNISPVKAIDEQGRERYQYKDGTIITGRVTDIQKLAFEKGKSKAQIEEIENNPRNIIAREIGTQLHDINEVLLNYKIGKTKNLEVGINTKATNTLPKRPINIKDEHFLEMGRSINELANQISIQQNKIDPNSKAIIFTENFLIDKKKDIAGSQDVLVIYSDGSVSIYDYKFINFKREKIDGTWTVPSDAQIGHLKEKSYSLQISEYKRILKDEYNITNFRATRILPFNVQYRFKDGKPTNTLLQLEGFKIGEKDYLLPIPVAKELTENKDINKLLSNLYSKQDSLIRKIKSAYSNSEDNIKALQIESDILDKSIKAIILSGDFEPLFKSINKTLDNIAKLTTNVDLSNIGELNEAISEIKLYNTIYEDTRHFIKDNSLQDKLAIISRRLMDARIILNDKLEEILSNEFEGDLITPQKELGFFKRNLNYMSQIDHPIFQAAWDKIKEAQGNTNRAVTDFISRIEPISNNLKSWASSKGISTIDAYRKLINQKNGKLISKISGEFLKTVKSKRQNEDIQWFKENYIYTEEGREIYKTDLENYKSKLDKIIPDTKYRERKLEQWKNINDLTRDSAWLSKWPLIKYTELKNEETSYSNEYKELLKPDNKALKEYYDFYIEANQTFNQLVDEKIDKNFVANIRKDMVDTLAQNGSLIQAIKTGGQNFWNGMQVRQNEEMLTEDTDDLTIPLLYYDNFMVKQKDGNYAPDMSAKNEDLTNNIILFAESVFRKNNMTQIKDIINALKLQINNGKVIKTNIFGVPKRDPVTQEFIEIESKKNVEVFDGLTKSLVYNKRIQNKDTNIQIGDKIFSLNKILLNIMNYLSTKSLAGNLVSGIGNFGGAYANSYIKGIEGKFYNPKQMWESHKMLMKGDKRYGKLAAYFNIERDHWVKAEAAKLSASKLTEYLTADKWFILQQKGDEFIANTILIAMMHNYGIDSDGKIKKLINLPEGNKSLIDKVTEPNNKIEIEGLDDAAFDQFRNMVKYVSRQVKGTNTFEDISMMQTTVWGKSIMHFRNWIAPLVKERFGTVTYTKDIDEYEYGRYKSTWNAIFNDRVKNNLTKLMLDIVTLGKIKFKGDTELLKKQYNQFKLKNPDSQISESEYLDLRERTIRAGIHEIKVITGIFLAMMLMKGDWDDDGEEWYKRNVATRQAYKYISRVYLEMSFFTNPSSVKDILKSPVPIINVGTDMLGFIENTWDEATDRIFGLEGEPGDARDRTPALHYAKKQVPILRSLDDLWQDFNKE